MSFNEVAIQSISILIFMILIETMLRNLGILKEEHAQIFVNLILSFTLPALIFASLSLSNFSFDHIILSFIMLVTEAVSAFIALGIGSALKLSRPKKGAFILASTFGSSGFLGYALIKIIFPNDVNILTNASMVSEMGVAISLFTFGIFIAMYYGDNDKNYKEIKKEILEASMPAATMTAIFAKKYNCDSELTTILIFATFVASFGTMVMMVWLM